MGLERGWGQGCVPNSDSGQGARTEPLASARALGASGMLEGDCTVTSSLFILAASINRQNNFFFRPRVF